MTLVALAAACGGGPPPARPAPPVDELGPRLAEHEATTCACASAACLAAADRALRGWAAQHHAAVDRAYGDAARVRTIEAHDDRVGACRSATTEAEAARAEAELVARFEAVADAMCACVDQACLDQATEALETIEQTASPDGDALDRVEAAVRQGTQCRAQLEVSLAPKPPVGIVPPAAVDLDRYLKGLNGAKGLKGKGALIATIDTTMGAFHCTLYEREAPMTVANFVGLASGQKPWLDGDGVVQQRPFYDGLGFHRVIPDFMIQGGDPLGTGTGGPGYAFANEIDPALHHDGPGVLSMANAGPDTNGSQFFITEKATAWLDGRHTIFGRCKEGALVKKITALAGPRDRPTRPVTIKTITFARAKR